MGKGEDGGRPAKSGRACKIDPPAASLLQRGPIERKRGGDRLISFMYLPRTKYIPMALTMTVTDCRI